MPDETPNPDAPENASDEDTPNAEPEMGEAGKRALERERKARREAVAKLKELEPLAAKARELEEANKTEVQKASERADTAERRVQPLELENLRLRIALEKELPANLATRLQGETPDDIAEDADRLLELVSQRGPRPDFGQGAGRGPGVQEGTDPDQWLRELARRR